MKTMGIDNEPKGPKNPTPERKNYASEIIPQDLFYKATQEYMAHAANEGSPFESEVAAEGWLASFIDEQFKSLDRPFGNEKHRALVTSFEDFGLRSDTVEEIAQALIAMKERELGM